MRLRTLSVAAIATIGVAATIASGSSKSSGGGGGDGKTSKPDSGNPALKDVSIESCAKDTTLGYPKAAVKITNNSSKPSNYIVTVAFNSPDGKTQYDTGTAAANNLGPGQSTTQDAASLKEVAGKFVCKLVDVTRYAS